MRIAGSTNLNIILIFAHESDDFGLVTKSSGAEHVRRDFRFRGVGVIDDHGLVAIPKEIDKISETNSMSLAELGAVEIIVPFLVVKVKIRRAHQGVTLVKTFVLGKRGLAAAADARKNDNPLHI